MCCKSYAFHVDLIITCSQCKLLCTSPVKNSYKFVTLNLFLFWFALEGLLFWGFVILFQFYAALLLTHRLQKVTLHLLLYIPPFVFVTRCSLHVSAFNFVVCWNHIRKSSSPLCCPLCCNWAENKNQCQKDLYFSLHLRILNCNHRLKLRPTGHYATEWLIHKHQGPPSDRPILVVDIKLSSLRTDIFRHCKRITGCFRDMWR